MEQAGTAFDGPRVAVIIPCRDRPELLRECLDALRTQPQALIDEIVVVDTSANEDVANVVRAFPLVRRITAGGPLLPGPARNLGVNATSAPLLAFLDADCRPDAGWLRAAVHSLTTDADVVGGPILDARPWHPIAAAAHFLQNADHGPGRPAQPVGYLPGANLAMRREALVELGGFADAWGEDTILTRAAAARWPERVRFQPHMVVRHTGVSSWKGLWPRHVALGAARAHTGPPPTIVRWLGTSPPAMFAAILARFGYIATCTLRWHPTAFLRLVLFAPWVCVGLAAWAAGYARAYRLRPRAAATSLTPSRGGSANCHARR